jgi:endonuclease/exonuclease/phosphatase family metal-dependent hydrolase
MQIFLKSISWIILIFTLICYSAVLIPPEKFWPAGLLGYGILPLMIINLVLFFILFILRKKIILVPLTGIITGILFFNMTFQFNFYPSQTKHSDQINVMSYNVRGFKWVRNSPSRGVEWVVNDSAGIKCIQEFYSSSRRSELNLLNKMTSRGYFSHILQIDEKEQQHFGLAIFSRYPVIDKGSLILNEQSGNNCIYADFKVQDDTIRIYNVHLASMRIPLYAYRNPENYDSKLISLINKLRNGAIRRSNEIDLIFNHTKSCPYPFIICGDFNDIPYSYNYMKLRNRFTNSFETAGTGFGFSFNHKLFFLRIDHHFVSDGIIPVRFWVDRSIKESDHFPTRGLYQVR